MVELLAPAGNFISLRAALENGTDSVYIGLKDNNMRANVSNFSLTDIKEASKIVKEYSSKLYLCTNTIMKDEDINRLKSDLEKIKQSEIDALIVSDIGLVEIATDIGIDPHISVQENISNSYALKTLKKLGATRAILSRELNINEIKVIATNSPIETEIFIHGAMCMAVSGRCFLSYGLYGKTANCGECLQPCRKDWKLSIAQNQDSDFYYKEDADSSFILKTNSDLNTNLDDNLNYDNYNNTCKTNFISPNDMAMIEYIPELVGTGVNAFKIEGRARSPDYVATTTKVYRGAINSHDNDKINYKFNPKWLEELKTVFNRGFDTGFYFKQPYKISEDNQSKYIKKDIAKVVNYYSKIKVAELQLWDDLAIGDKIMIQGKTTGSITHKIQSMEINGKSVDYCKKGENVAIAIDKKVRYNDFVYKLIER